MTWTLTLLRWTARVLGTAIAEAVDWDDVDVAERFGDERLAEAIDWEELALEDHAGPDQLADAISWGTVDALEERVADEILSAAIVDELDHLASPVDAVRLLEDTPERSYVWLVETEEAVGQVERLISEEYRATYGREPEAAHFVVSDLEELREFDADELAYWVDPPKAGGDD